jgi:hypothetical protein
MIILCYTLIVDQVMSSRRHICLIVTIESCKVIQDLDCGSRSGDDFEGVTSHDSTSC